MKAGFPLAVSRNTIDPPFITVMLMTILEVRGTQVSLRCCESAYERMFIGVWIGEALAKMRFLVGSSSGNAKASSDNAWENVRRIHNKVLMCLTLVNLLDDTLKHLDTELLVSLNAKLCRRLVKLQVDKNQAPPSLRAIYEYMFKLLRTDLGKLIVKLPLAYTKTGLGSSRAFRSGFPPGAASKGARSPSGFGKLGAIFEGDP